MSGEIDLTKIGNFFTNGAEYVLELRAGVLPSDDASTPLDGRVLLNAPGPDINGLKAALADIQVNWVIDGTGDFPEGTVWNYGPGETTFSLLGDVVFGIKLDPNNLNFITAYTLVNSEAGILDGSNYVELTPQQLMDANYLCAGILVTLPSIADVVPVPSLKRLLISNPNDVGNMPVEIKIGNETVFLNKGPDGAVIDGADGTDVAICLSPRQAITDAFVNKTKPVTLEGTFAIEVDGEVIPVSYIAEDLPKVFKPTSAHGISFQKQIGEGTQLILQNEMRTRDKEVRIIRVSKEGLLSPQVDDYFQDLSNGVSAEIGIFLSPTTTFNCDGALTETNQFDLDGKWGVEINGVTYGEDENTIDELIPILADHGLELVIFGVFPESATLLQTVNGPDREVRMEFKNLINNVTVDWGDGSINNIPANTEIMHLTHTYGGNGVNQIAVYTKDNPNIVEVNPIVFAVDGAVEELVRYGKNNPFFGIFDDGATDICQLIKVPETLPEYIGHPTITKLAYGRCALFNQPISQYDVSSVYDMDNFANGASLFKQDLSGWCVPGIMTKPVNFDTGSLLEASDLPVWGTCPNPKTFFGLNSVDNRDI